MVKLENERLWDIGNTKKIISGQSVEVKEFNGDSFEQELYFSYPSIFIDDLVNSYYTNKYITNIVYTFYFNKGTFKYCKGNLGDNTRVFIKQITYIDANNDETSIETNENIYYDDEYRCFNNCGSGQRCTAIFSQSKLGGKWGKPSIETMSNVINKINIGFFGRGDQEIVDFDLRYDIEYEIKDCSVSSENSRCRSFKQYCEKVSDDIVFRFPYKNLYTRRVETFLGAGGVKAIRLNDNIFKIYVNDVDGMMNREDMLFLLIKTQNDELILGTGITDNLFEINDFEYNKTEKSFTINIFNFAVQDLIDIEVGYKLFIGDKLFNQKEVKIIKNKQVPSQYNESCGKIKNGSNNASFFSKNKIYIIIGITLFILLLIVFIIVIVILKRRNKSKMI